VTLDGDAAFESAKYIGQNPHGRLDDGTFHSALQDFRFGARMSVLVRPLFVTPFMQVSVPSHHYQWEGHTAVGKGRAGVTTGVYAGRDLGPFLPNAYFEVMGSHTFVQRTEIGSTSERLNRTNASLEVGYAVTPAVTLSVFGLGLRTHGGWDLPRAFNNTEEIVEHDRFDKTKDIQIGGAIAYTFPRGLTVYGGYFGTVWARTAHGLAGPTLGFTWSLQPAERWLARNRRRPAMMLARN
jgi:hypothetical protein